MKAVIFDLDGTLADSLESIAHCTNRTLAEFGFASLKKERYKYFVGDGAAELVKRALLASGDSSLSYLEQAKARYAENFKEDCMYHVVPYEGITDTLEALKKRGILLAVNSNKPHARTVEVIHTLFGTTVFDAVQGQTDTLKRKPSPDGIFHIAKTLQVGIEDIVYVGDTSTDMKTGKAAGVYTVGVLWGFRDREELEENHADAIISHPAELLQL